MVQRQCGQQSEEVWSEGQPLDHRGGPSHAEHVLFLPYQAVVSASSEVLLRFRNVLMFVVMFELRVSAGTFSIPIIKQLLLLPRYQRLAWSCTNLL